MTANAMVGDKEKVLDAGMNDHIARPINVDKMFTTMARWITPSTPAPMEVTKNESSIDEPVLPDLPGIDLDAGLAVAQGNVTLFRKLLVKFRQSHADYINDYQAAQQSDTPETAARLVHTLKGVAGNIGATAVHQACLTLEKAEDCSDDDHLMLLRDLAGKLDTVIDGLAVLDKTKQSKILEWQVDQGEIDSVLTRLRTLLEDNDADATEVIMELEAFPESTINAKFRINSQEPLISMIMMRH